MFPSLHRFAVITLVVSACLSSHLVAGDSTPAAYQTSADTGNGYGFFGWLDHRSAYGQGAFPEPFLVDDVDLETNEARLDWLHTNAKNQRSDQVTAEVEKGFGLLTVELEVPYERTTDTSVVAGRAVRVTDLERTDRDWVIGKNAFFFSLERSGRSSGWVATTPHPQLS